MNEIVLTLAQRTAVLLESSCSEQYDDVQTISAVRYFSRLGRDFKEPEGIDHPDDIDILCTEINSTLNFFEKIYLLLLIQDCLLNLHRIEEFTRNLRVIYGCLGVDGSLMEKFRMFFEQENLFTIKNNEYLLISPQNVVDNEMLEGRWIENNVPRGRDLTGNIALSQISDHLLVMFVEPIRTYVVRCINHSGKLFDQDGEHYCNFRLLQPGNELSIDGIPVLTFSELKSRFLHLNEKRELSLSIDRIQYTNSKGIKEIHSFSASETTGQLIGIVGREGVGKTTLLNLLAGKFKPGEGNVSINGYDLWKHKYLLKGVIGFVSEEDLLFEELSVSDNLTLTARLYYSNLSKKEIEAKVNALLSRIDLIELKHVIVGNIDNKTIQPGQRRLINIALELLREPQILLVDNALSGLGMSDASKVIKVLHDYSFSGNLVITSISQVDSETFMLFDKIWILDEGGYPVYNGSVKAAPGYLFKNLKLRYKEKEKTDPAQLLDWVNYRLPDKDAHVWKRVVEPHAWHNVFVRDQALHDTNSPERTLLPARILKIPNLEVQLLIFSIRNFKCKFSRILEIIKALMVGPLIAVFVGLLMRSGSGGEYTLLNNDNLPLFQFISVVIAIFLGLIASVDEMIRERNIFEKEQYLEFSRFSYLNSKIFYLFPIIAIQIVLYVFTANFIMGIRELFGTYWLVLFSASCFGVLLGLVISGSFRSREFMYKGALPLILGIQLFLGGGIISYDRLNLGDHRYTPLIGDLMVSRWGYEALAVEQFKNNSYQKLMYPIDQKLNMAGFYSFGGVPQMEHALATCFTSSDKDSVKNSLAFLQHEMTRAAEITEVFPFEYVSRMSEILENENMAQEVSGYITYLGMYYYEQYDTLLRHKNHRMEKLTDSLGVEQLDRLKKNYHNHALEQIVTNSNSDLTVRIIDNKMVRTSGMIFDEPESDWGRAALFSPVKLFKRDKTETLWFNVAIIWLLTAICYIWILFDFTGIIRNFFRR